MGVVSSFGGVGGSLREPVGSGCEAEESGEGCGDVSDKSVQPRIISGIYVRNKE